MDKEEQIIKRLEKLAQLIKKHNYVMCQKFLPKINKGDKRVFIINGKIVGFALIIELLELNDRDKIKDYRSESLVEY